MRIESSVTALSWIPSEAVTGMLKVPFEIGAAHYDPPPPAVVTEPGRLVEEGQARFANVLRAAIDVEDGRIVGHEHLGTSHVGHTKMSLGPKTLDFAPVIMPTITPEPEVGDGWVRFVQTAGARTAAPAPRRVNRPPYVQMAAPTAWSTLTLTLHADGRVEHEVSGASPFPRHWIYDEEGELVGKSGTIDFKQWSLESFGEMTPWGEHDSPAMITAVETALERELSQTIMGGKKPKIRKLKESETLVEQGETGDEMFLLLDGVLVVVVDGEELAELGPGAILGERAILEGGLRTSTLRAVTSAKVAVASADQIDQEALERLAVGHRREEDEQAGA